MVALTAQGQRGTDRPMHVVVPKVAISASPSDERAMLAALNALRTAAGERRLILDASLTTMARRYARTMLEQQFIGHTDPSGHTMADRFRAARVRFRTAGENLAFAPDAGGAERLLEKSPPHRRNLLDRSFSRVGIGAVRAGPHAAAYVQEFAGG